MKNRMSMLFSSKHIVVVNDFGVETFMFHINYIYKQDLY